MALRIWLADLFHDKVSVLDVVPLNLGYLASALQHTHGNDVDLRLFKYPDALTAALEKDAPDVLALSYYTWNAELSLHFARYVRERSPRTKIVMGGPNIRIDAEGLRSFLEAHPYIDVYIPLEGETALSNLVHALKESNLPESIGEVAHVTGTVPGCYLNVPEYSFEFLSMKRDNPNLSYGSPYLKGLLDEFLQDERLVPIFETNRGCPYTCTFCAWGISVLNKLRTRDMEEVLGEFNYVAENSAKQELWFFADANFGILDRDIELAKHLRQTKDERGFPKALDINWAKNSGKRILEIVKILKDMTPGQIAVQSFDEETLKHMKRKNLKNPMIRELIAEYHSQGFSISTDFLVGCSGESLDSHFSSVRKGFELEYDNFNLNNIRMLPGSEMESDVQRKQYGFQTRYRFIPNSYGVYNDTFVYEIEEAIKASNTMTEEEMDGLKTVHFLVYALWNSRFARDLLRLGLRFDVNPLDVILAINNDSSLSLYHEILAPLAEDYRNEWFPDEAALREHYDSPDVWQQIVTGEGIEKLTWKYMAKLLLREDLIHELIGTAARFMETRCHGHDNVIEILKEISEDRIRVAVFDDMSDESYFEKRKRYELSLEDYELLRSLDCLPDDIHYDVNGFELQFLYRKEDYQYVNTVLKRCGFSDEPVRALSAALGNGMLSYFTYAVKGAANEESLRAAKPYAQV